MSERAYSPFSFNKHRIILHENLNVKLKIFDVFLCSNIQNNAIASQLIPQTATLRKELDFHHTFVARARAVREYSNNLKCFIMQKQRKKFLPAVIIMLSSLKLSAQGNGTAGITEATQMVTSYFDPATQLIYAIGAVVGLIGGVKVYNKFSSGDPDTSKTAASWFGACIFLIVAATILRSFFL